MKQIKENAKTKMEKSINVMLSDFAGIRAGRANPSVLNKVQVEYYGAMTPVTQMAAVSVAEARVLVIQPWDKSTLKPIEKAIQASDIGINPQNDGSVIRLTFPQLTEDRRKELVKDIKKMGEECKVAIRSICLLYTSPSPQRTILRTARTRSRSLLTGSLRKLTVTLPKRKKRYSLSKPWRRMRR